MRPDGTRRETVNRVAVLETAPVQHLGGRDGPSVGGRY